MGLLGRVLFLKRSAVFARTLVSKTQRKAEKKAIKNSQRGEASREELRLAFRNGKVLPYEFEETRSIAKRLVESFRDMSGTPLFPALFGASNIPRSLWEAPVACIVVCDGSNSIDSAEGGSSECVYANLLAVELHGAASFAELIGSAHMLPSSLGVKMFESGYCKKIRHGSHQLTLRAANRWQLEIDETARTGVAYAFTKWELDDGTLCGPAGLRLALPLSLEAKEQIEVSVGAVAMEIRRLKECEGRGNKDALVLTRVSEMKRLRSQLLADETLRKARGNFDI